MFKFIGVVAVVGGLALGVAVLTGNMNFKTQADLTPQGKQQLQSAREKTADVMRDAADATAGK